MTKHFVITVKGQSSRKAFYAAQRENDGLLTKTVFETAAKFDGAPGSDTAEEQAERLMSKAGGKFNGVTAPAGCFYVTQPTETEEGTFVFFGQYDAEQVKAAKAKAHEKAAVKAFFGQYDADQALAAAKAKAAEKAAKAKAKAAEKAAVKAKAAEKAAVKAEAAEKAAVKAETKPDTAAPAAKKAKKAKKPRAVKAVKTEAAIRA